MLPKDSQALVRRQAHSEALKAVLAPHQGLPHSEEGSVVVLNNRMIKAKELLEASLASLRVKAILSMLIRQVNRLKRDSTNNYNLLRCRHLSTSLSRSSKKMNRQIIKVGKLT